MKIPFVNEDSFWHWMPPSLLAGRTFPRELLKCAEECLERAQALWREVDSLGFSNSARVLSAFQAERVSQLHLHPSTGYAFDDPGREALDRVFARVFGAESACVSPHWISGTHVIASALRALLLPGEELLSVTGEMYETLKPVVRSMVKELNIRLRCADPLNLEGSRSCGVVPREMLERSLRGLLRPETRVVFVQRSRGYSMRRTCSVAEIGAISEIVHEIRPDVSVLVDNCYGEFTETVEPTMVGADIAVGSLIKNPGGGLCPIGGYAVGKKNLVDRVRDALYAPGIGRGSGANPLGYRQFFQGLFIGPHVVAESLKGAIFASLLFEKLGYEVSPGPDEPRSDIVQCIILETPERLRTFVRAIQSCSPVDSGAVPEPWAMPGYDREVIMAAGTFVDGSSIELSCDGPFTEPYAAFLQGGMFKEHVIMAAMVAAMAVGPARGEASWD